MYFFVTRLQGANANELPMDLGISYKPAFTNVSKVREVLYKIMDLTPLDGTVHSDCHILRKTQEK